MRVVLVVPKNKVSLASDCSPPLGLAYIASYLRENIKNVEIRILDGTTGIDPLQQIVQFQPDIVGITATTPQIPSAYELAAAIKQNLPHSTVVLGGPHVTVLPEEAVQYADFVVVGEGEKAFTDIVKKQMAHTTEKAPTIIQGTTAEDLDEIPSPAFDLLDMQFYLNRHFIEQVLPPPILGLVTSRGCPVKPACVFCYNQWRTSKVRYFSAQRVSQELQYLHETYKVSNFFFQDDEFLINTCRLKEMAKLFKEHGIDKWISWGCQARVTTLNANLLKIAQEMGCKLIVPGFESHNARLLDYLKNGSVKVEDIDRAVNLFKNSKILLGGNFIYGTPTETLQEMKENFQYFLDTPEITFMNANVLTPYPGTQVWQDCKQRGLIPDELDYSQLLPTDELQNAVNFSAIPKTQLINYLKDIRRTKRMVQQVRFNPTPATFWSASRKKLWWWMWLKHPKIMLKLIKETKTNTKSAPVTANLQKR